MQKLGNGLPPNALARALAATGKQAGVAKLIPATTTPKGKAQ